MIDFKGFNRVIYLLRGSRMQLARERSSVPNPTASSARGEWRECRDYNNNNNCGAADYLYPGYGSQPLIRSHDPDRTYTYAECPVGGYILALQRDVFERKTGK